MGDTTDSNTKILSGKLFLGVVALQMPIQKNHYYMCEMGPFPGTITFVTGFGKTRLIAGVRNSSYSPFLSDK